MDTDSCTGLHTRTHANDKSNSNKEQKQTEFNQTMSNSTATEVAQHMMSMVKSVMKPSMQKCNEDIKKVSGTVLSFEKAMKGYEKLLKSIAEDIQHIKSNSVPNTPIKSSDVTPVRTPAVKNTISLDIKKVAEAKTDLVVLDSDSDDESQTLLPSDDVLKVTFQPSGDFPRGLYFDMYPEEKKYVVFCRFDSSMKKDTMSKNASDLTKYHFVTKISDVDIDDMDLKKFVATFKKYSKGKEPFEVHFKELSDVQKQAYDKYKENEMKKRRAALWKYYQMFFSDGYRRKNRRSHYRYRPDCKTCGDRSAIDVLEPMVDERYKEICKALDKMLSIQELYKMMDDATESRWNEIVRMVEPHELMKKQRPASPKRSLVDLDDEHLMSFKDPRAKKQKTLKDEFIEKGKGDSNTYDTLREKFDEAMIRTMFGL
tara:strand:+ start:216 stop:1496 length:1281 start_codon:yes stop_codon:yes gene_type:complete